MTLSLTGESYVMNMIERMVDTRMNINKYLNDGHIIIIIIGLTSVFLHLLALDGPH